MFEVITHSTKGNKGLLQQLKGCFIKEKSENDVSIING